MRSYLSSHRLAHALKLATLLCVLAFGLLVPGVPAQAITTYDVNVGAMISSGGPVPDGTGLMAFLGAGSILTPAPIHIGNASAFSAGHTAPQFAPFPPSTSGASAQASGGADGPPNSFAASFASAVNPSVLFNLNNTTETFPLLLDGFILTGTTLGQDQLANAQANGSVQLLIDGTAIPIERVGNFLTVNDPSAFHPLNLHPAITIFTVQVTPGFHSVLLEVQADGFASEITPIPEPTTLLLFGTAAGLGLARWYQRRTRGQQDAA